MSNPCEKVTWRDALIVPCSCGSIVRARPDICSSNQHLRAYFTLIVATHEWYGDTQWHAEQMGHQVVACLVRRYRRDRHFELKVCCKGLHRKSDPGVREVERGSLHERAREVLGWVQRQADVITACADGHLALDPTVLANDFDVLGAEREILTGRVSALNEVKLKRYSQITFKDRRWIYFAIDVDIDDTIALWCRPASM